MSKAMALRVEKVSVCSPCFTTGVPSNDNCNWLIVYSSCPTVCSSWAIHFLFQEYRSMLRRSQRTLDGMSLQLASFLVMNHQETLRKMLVIRQNISSHRGREE